MRFYTFFKRIFDFIGALLAIIILSPFLLLIVLLIKLDSPGPILFKQRRIGRGKTIFNIYKFRTMRIDTPKDMPTHLLDDPEKYITRVGKFLRKSSLDELPQIFNILKGEMSIVGPRPALWNQDDLTAERDKYGANNVLPGLTGWAQVNGRDELPIPVKAEYDGYYIEHMSLLFDIRIVILTFVCALTARGVVEGTSTERNIPKR
jgi:O-antigen biosynthesis protein WbqP